MSDYTPTTKTVLAYIRGNAVMAEATADEAQAAAVGWLAEVERAAAEKALTDAVDQVNAKAKAYADSAIGLRAEKEWADSNRYSNYAAGLDMAANEIHKTAEAYRREGKEQ